MSIIGGKKKGKEYDDNYPKSPLFEIDPERDASYINLTILDASEAVKNTVKEKLEAKRSTFLPSIHRPQKFKDRVANQIDKMATKVGDKVPASYITNGSADSIPKSITYALARRLGMKVAAETVFMEESYLVIQFQIQYVDSQKIMDIIKLKASAASTSDDKKNKMKNNDNDAIKHDGDDEDEDIDPIVIDEWIREQNRFLNEGRDGFEYFHDEDVNTAINKTAADAENNYGSRDNISDDMTFDALIENWRLWIVNVLEWIIEKLIPDKTIAKFEATKLPSILEAKIRDELESMLEGKLRKKNLVADVSVLSCEK